MTSGADAELGAHVVDDGARFAIYAPDAERVDLCLFDEADREKRAITLPDCDDGVWHTFVPGCPTGQRYGYRAYGAWAPQQGLRFDSSKVLVDPYARELSGDLYWSNTLF
ncbi:MAG: glycogen debranching enzyme GlgX, partial [Pseudomonadota bacterium]